MKNIRNVIPIVGAIALAAMFLKLPETPDVFSFFHCKTCASSDPYLPLLGAGYFSLLIAISLLFPSFPGPRAKRGGLAWAILLAIALTIIDLPGWCLDCLIGHACNIFIWAIWMAVPAPEGSSSTTVRERVCLTVFAPMSVVALFSCLNLTFMAYKTDRNIIPPLQVGDAIPAFNARTNTGRSITNAEIGRSSALVINFIAPDCPYCKNQLPIVESVATQRHDGCRFINISPVLSPDLIKRSPSAEWIQDNNGTLRQLFRVAGTPTLFVVKGNGKIVDAVAGVPDKLKETLSATLENASRRDRVKLARQEIESGKAHE